MTAAPERGPSGGERLTVTYQPGATYATIRDSDGGALADVFVFSAESESDVIARAYTMAAAPQLLAALEELSDGPLDPCWCPWQSADGYHARRCQSARAAYAAVRPMPRGEGS